MNNVCIDCTHWKKTVDNDKVIKGKCSCEKFVYDDLCPIDGLEYWDFENYKAGFYTGPNFGCVHWEES
jgi:hypothetical protein